MRFWLASTILIALVENVAALPSPFPGPPLAAATSNNAIYLGPAGAMLEADYFHGPQPQYGTRRVFPCRFHLHVARESRIVQSCD